MRKMLPLAMAAALWLPCLPAAADETAGSAAPMPEARKQALAALTSDLPGAPADSSGAPEFYTDNLWEYIDGGAEAFIGYDMIGMIHRVVKTGGAEVTVDVYDMGDSLNAFGIYSSERSPDYRFLPVGGQGYGDMFSFNFWNGPYYAKLSLYQEGTPDSTLLRGIAESLAARTGRASGVPSLFDRFPARDAVVHSEKYVKKSPLGYGFLGPACARSYNTPAGPMDLVVIAADGPVQAAEWIEKLKSHFIETGKAAPVAGLGAGAFQGSNDYEGNLVIAAAGRFLAVQNSQEPMKTPRLEELIGNLNGVK
jgi:hypothetical protein